MKRGAIIAMIDNGETTAGIISRVITERTSYEDGPDGRSYDVTVGAVRLFPDTDEVPRVPEVRITRWESDAMALAANDPDHRYGWTDDGDRSQGS